MRGMDERSVDAIVTDPPYGLEFMGKKWDALEGQSAEDGRKMHEWHYRWAREALRVLKPGGHLLAFGGTRTYHRLACAIEDARFEIRDCVAWLYGSGFPKSANLKGGWDGWGTALKPAFEPIVVARKPPRGSVEKNVIVYGTGALNIDGCRIGEEVTTTRRNGNSGGTVFGRDERVGSWENPPGRWPANVVLDEEAGQMLDEQTGDLGLSTGRRTKIVEDNIYGGNRTFQLGKGQEVGYGDSGGPSRFFYCAKASRSERDAGLDGFEPQNPWDRNSVTRALEGLGSLSQARANYHPTVKPVELMRWLVRLITPPGGTVLDPFAGSGSTGIAAALEGFEFIGIEKDPSYVEIAEARIAHWTT
jgi:site-specific DNA-methyltransferase (adenine-specific)